MSSPTTRLLSAWLRRLRKKGPRSFFLGLVELLSLTQRTARKLKDEVEVYELDVTDTSHLDKITESLQAKWGSLDGVLHAIAFAPASCLGGGFLDAPWEDVATALNVSAFSFKSLTTAFCHCSRKPAAAPWLVSISMLRWRGLLMTGWALKAALESTSRYLARDLGADNVRVNLVAAGPVRTMAAKSIPGFDKFEDAFTSRAPSGLGHS